MFLNVECQQITKHSAMSIYHHFPGLSNKTIIGSRHERINIVRHRILRSQVTGSSKKEQAQSVVKQRSGRNDLILSGINIETKVSEMAIFIADYGIKHGHVVQRINIGTSQRFVIFPDSSEATLPY